MWKHFWKQEKNIWQLGYIRSFSFKYFPSKRIPFKMGSVTLFRTQRLGLPEKGWREERKATDLNIATWDVVWTGQRNQQTQAGNSCFPVHIQPSRRKTRVSHTVKTLMPNSSKAWPAHSNQSSWFIHPPMCLQATHMFIRLAWLPFSVCASSPSFCNLKSPSYL